MDIDHFIPQNERPALKYEWTNLYPADHKANMMKPRITPPDGYLNPCNPAEDVENEILYHLEVGGGQVHFKARNIQNTKAINTSALLNRLHKRLQIAIKTKYDEVIYTIAEWGAAKAKGDHQKVFEKEVLLKMLLSRGSSFSMLMRSILVVRDLPSEFFD